MKFKRPLIRLRPLSLKLLLAGHILIVIALCDFAARLHAGLSVEPLLYISEFMRSVSVSVILLWGVGLGLDFWGRWNDEYTS